ncbi:hypothetical protein EH240_19785 [Mesorhizobium tamadayense]|uniref:ParB-like N-terminal domain-containing protein n=1 Tax=Mesorhizobium tamadayense TaxID=425306 RepID=A0A3P3FH82_9HYPH|nr:ParB N-terminal domain-containing protein [Mesorhizobium tamadayense]RRH98040.1 hypothetical protein EH240_19785 [Mesorhizobium tamadayense]
MALPSKSIAIVDIEIAAIDVPAGRRRLDPAWVETLTNLFRTQGQKTPIEVIATGERFRLVFGHHRLAAARLLGSDVIAAVVKRPEDFASEAEIALAEITENLARRELSALDRAVDIARWREVYETANGAVRRGRPSKLVQVAPISDEGDERFAASFSEAARKALGISRDAIKRAMRIASIGAGVRDRIALHPVADNQSELLLLATEPADRQADIAALLTAEPAQAASVADALAILDRLPPPAREPAWQKLATAFSKMRESEQDRFFTLHEAAIQRWLKGRN